MRGGGECGAKRGSLPSPSRDRVTKNHLCHSTAVSTVDSTDEVRGGGLVGASITAPDTLLP